MKILSLFALGSLILLGGCQPREAGRTAPEPQPGSSRKHRLNGGGNGRSGAAPFSHQLHGRH